MKTLKALIVTTAAPLLIVTLFFSKQIEVKEPSRGPAVEKAYKAKSVKNAVKGYILAVNGK